MKRLVFMVLSAAACSSSGDARLALPAGARVVAEASTAAPLGRVETQACVTGSGAVVAEATRAALAPTWGTVQLLPNPSVAGRWVVVGARDGSGVSGVVDEVRRGPCAEGEVLVSLGVHSIPPEERRPARSVGAAGVRAAAAGRAPVVLPPVSEK